MNITPNEGAGAGSVIENAGQAANTGNEQNQENQQGSENQGGEGQKTYTAEDFGRLEKQLQKEQRRINRLTAAKYSEKSQNQILLEKIAKLEKASAPKDERPKIEDYEEKGFDAYNEAVARWAARQEGKPKEGAQSEDAPQSKVPPQEQAWAKQMEENVTHQATQLAQHIPDFAETFQENEAIFDAMPYELEKAFYQTQHPALAAYVLAKEGKLVDLLEMTPQQAAYEIGRAIQVGVNNIKSWSEKKAQGKVTNAPAPLSSPNKGTGPGGKSEDAMSGRELRKKHGVL
jgi:hypothetical protein